MGNLSNYTPNSNQNRPQYDYSNVIDALYQLLFDNADSYISQIWDKGGLNNPVESSIQNIVNPIEINKQYVGKVIILPQIVGGAGLRVTVSTASGVAGFLPQIKNETTGAIVNGIIPGVDGIYVLDQPYKYITFDSVDGVTPQQIRIALGCR